MKKLGGEVKPTIVLSNLLPIKPIPKKNLLRIISKSMKNKKRLVKEI